MILIGLTYAVLVVSVVAAEWDPAPWRRADLPPLRGELPRARVTARKTMQEIRKLRR